LTDKVSYQRYGVLVLVREIDLSWPTVNLIEQYIVPSPTFLVILAHFGFKNSLPLNYYLKLNVVFTQPVIFISWLIWHFTSWLTNLFNIIGVISMIPIPISPSFPIFLSKTERDN
jgi:hypothetical protein